MDEQRRCAFLSEFCNAMLRWHDWVGYTDSDIARLKEEGVIKGATPEEISRHGGAAGTASAHNPHDP